MMEQFSIPDSDTQMLPSPVPEPVHEHTDPQPVFIVVMGVSGTGKSTLGTALARALSVPYVEGDDLHPRANVEKMARGQPLDDADREPWLELIRRTAVGVVCKGEGENEGRSEDKNKHRGVVISCSALKVYYRDILRGKLTPGPIPMESQLSEVAENANESENESEKKAYDSSLPPITPSPKIKQNTDLSTYFVFIDGPRDILLDRMEKRPGHFMKASMLDSQLATLESPVGEKGVVVVSLLDSTEEQVRLAVGGLNLGAEA